MAEIRRVALGLTGASGIQYGLRLLEQLLACGIDVDVVVSKAAQVVASMEMDITLPGRANELQAFLLARCAAPEGTLRVYAREDWRAPMASGSNPPDAMVICPCTTGTLAAVAHGLSDNLIERAADVVLKEGRKLILVPRESPYSVIHLENMLKLARLGTVILPPSPGFYHRPRSVADMVDFVVARILDQLGVTHQLMPRWGEDA